MKYLTTGLICFFSLPVFAQRLSAELFAGISNYQGDLQESRFTFSQSNAAFGVGLGYQITNNFSVRAMATYGKIQANDKYNHDSALIKRNLSFHSNIYDLSVTGVYDFIDLSQHRFSPYVLGGISFFHFNPYAYDSAGNEVNLRALTTEGQNLNQYPDRKMYSLNQFSIPFGGGVHFAVTEKITLGFEIRMHKTFTDYLDDVSKTYVDRATLLAARGQQSVDFAFRGNQLESNLTYPPDGTVRGSPQFKDWYYFTGLTVNIKLPMGYGDGWFSGGRHSKMSRIDCPTNVH